MSEVSLFELLKEGDIDNCYQFTDQASQGGEHLVQYLNTLLHYSASIKWEKETTDHPLIVINSIKNIISDNRDKPSKILLKYCLDIIIEKPIRDDNRYIDQIKNIGIGSSVFVGSLEDAIQSGDWEKAKITAAKIFLASDNSRAVIDAISDLGLQNIENNGLFIFHMLRAFYFKQEKAHIWAYACCLINILQSAPLPEPHIRKDLEPNNLIDQILSYNDVELLATYIAIHRIWSGDYIRQNSYNREISHWLSKLDFSFEKIDKNEAEIKLDKNIIYNNYIDVAENIISQKSSVNQISINIIILEAIRYIEIIKPDKNLYYYANQIINS
jgi:hypothetical protein